MNWEALYNAHMRIIECIPNFSEGRNKKKIQSIAHAIKNVKGVKLLGVHSDPDHHRSVITFAGQPAAVMKAAFSAVKIASKLIDLRKHRGVHPRMGAADVVPLVPISGISERETVELARQLGQRIGDELKLPVYLYEKAALQPERKNLADIRRGGYEGIREDIGTLPHRAPDFGPKKVGPAGAVAIGVRFPLIAFNVNLRSMNLALAKSIAKKIRERNGGLSHVKAIGLKLTRRKMVQVSMNLTDYRVTSPERAFKAVERLAKQAGVTVIESELVGLIPKAALTVEPAKLKIKNFKPTMILENAVSVISSGTEE